MPKINNSVITDKSITKEKLNDELQKKINNIGNLHYLRTNDKDTLVNSINEIYNDTVNGKNLVANAIKQKGVTIGGETPSYQLLHDKILEIKTGHTTGDIITNMTGFNIKKTLLSTEYIGGNIAFLKNNDIRFFRYNNDESVFYYPKQSVAISNEEYINMTNDLLSKGFKKFEIDFVNSEYTGTVSTNVSDGVSAELTWRGTTYKYMYYIKIILNGFPLYMGGDYGDQRFFKYRTFSLIANDNCLYLLNDYNANVVSKYEFEFIIP